VPLVVIAPLVGIAIVPVTLPVGAGLTPSDVISVASIGIPVAPTDPPGLIPRGDVAPSEGIAASGSATGSSTWANAGLAQSNGKAVATIKKGLMEDSPIRAEGLRGDIDEFHIGLTGRNAVHSSTLALGGAAADRARHCIRWAFDGLPARWFRRCGNSIKKGFMCEGRSARAAATACGVNERVFLHDRMRLSLRARSSPTNLESRHQEGSPICDRMRGCAEQKIGAAPLEMRFQNSEFVFIAEIAVGRVPKGVL
jgi:hypothetical protein